MHQRRDGHRSPSARALCGIALFCTVLCAASLSGLSSPASAQPAPPSQSPPSPAQLQTGNEPAPAAAAEAPPLGDETLPRELVPAYYFSPLRFQGKVSPDGTVAELTAEIEVHITRDSGWYEVPLRLGQAAVTALKYSGPREPVPRESTEGQDDGLRWLFEGRGTHRLTLSLQAPVRRTPNGNNLQLSLPNVPRLFPTQLTLTIPAVNVQAEGGKDNLVRTATGPSGETVLQVTAVGTRIDLTWRVSTERPGTLVRAMTTATLDREDDRLRLYAVQDLVSDGRVPELLVRLPEAFRLVAVSGASYLAHDAVADQPGWVRVQLAPADRPELQLTWLLETDLPTDGRRVVIDGFEIRGAIRQTGTIGVARLNGFRVLRLTSDRSDGVSREDATRVRAYAPQTNTPYPFLMTAYKFERQPFELTLDLQRQRPVFTPRLRAILTTMEDRLLLDLDFAVRVDAGAVDDLVLRWPGGTAEGWTLQQADPGLLITDATDAASETPGELQRIQLPASQEADFTLHLQYQRPGSGGAFEVALPALESDRSLPTWLVLRGADAVEPTLDSTAPVEPLSDPAADGWLKDSRFAVERDRAYRVTSTGGLLSGFTEVHPLEFSASTRVLASESRGGAWHIRQMVDCTVRYGRVSALAFRRPSSFPVVSRGAAAAALVCRTPEGRELTVDALADDLLRVNLPEPTQGAISLLLEYALPAPESSRLDVPIFELQSGPYTSTLVEFPPSGTRAVTAADPGWERITTAFQPAWVAQDARQTFRADLAADVGSAPQVYVVDTAFVRLVQDLSGRSRLMASYHLRNAPDRIVISMPPAAEGATFSWNGAPLNAAAATETSDGARQELWLQTQGAAAEGWLELSFTSPASRELGALARLSDAFPTFPAAVAVARTYVELALPGDHCLLTYPEGLSPLLVWRPGLIFQRELTPAYRAQRSSLVGPAEGAAGPADAMDGAVNLYAFQALGPVERVEYRVISVWMLILLGSGLTLALAFLLWSVAATRSVLTVLVIAFLIALAGVFAAEVVELLLQPVLLGLAAAGVAIGTHTQRRQPPGWRHADPSSRMSPPPGSSAEARLQAMASTQLRPLEMQESGSRP